MAKDKYKTRKINNNKIKLRGGAGCIKDESQPANHKPEIKTKY
jgi:hypothetical protein